MIILFIDHFYYFVEKWALIWKQDFAIAILYLQEELGRTMQVQTNIFHILTNHPCQTNMCKVTCKREV